jgi:hypothetical protein
MISPSLNVRAYATKFVSPYHGHLKDQDGQLSETYAVGRLGWWLDRQGQSNADRAKLRRELAAILRDAGILLKGCRVHEYRVEPDADNRYRIVVFPHLPGFSTYHHSVTLTPVF